MIIRRRVNSNYTHIPNDIINNTNLSALGRFLMCYLLSKPDNWTIQAGNIAQALGIGRNSAYALVNECIKVGYIRRFKQREGTVHYEVRDLPDGGDEPFPQNREQDGNLPFPGIGEQEQKCQIPDSGNTGIRDLSNYSKKVVKKDLSPHDARASPAAPSPPIKASTFVREEDEPAIFKALEGLWLRDHPGRLSMPRCSRNGYTGWDFPTPLVQHVRDSGGKVAL